jgi:hypothetical protein
MMPVGSIRIFWLMTRERVGKNMVLLEQEMSRRFMENPFSPLSVLISRTPPVLCTSVYLLFNLPKK